MMDADCAWFPYGDTPYPIGQADGTSDTTAQSTPKSLAQPQVRVEEAPSNNRPHVIPAAPSPCIFSIPTI